MTTINRKPRIWFYRGAWRCAAMFADRIGVGPNPSIALHRWRTLNLQSPTRGT